MVLSRIRAVLGAERLDRARRSAVARRLERHPRGTIPARQAQRRGACGALCRHARDARRRGHAGSHAEGGGAAPSPRISAPATCPRGCAWAPTPSLRRFLGARPGTSSACSARRSRATGRRCRAPRPPRRRPEPCSSSQGSTIRRRSTSCLRPHHAHRRSDIVGSYEEAFDRIRALNDQGMLPRTVNLISGPSRTADIEQTIVRGAHGPSRLHVLILG